MSSKQNACEQRENGYLLRCIITTIITTDVYLFHINIIPICEAYKENKNWEEDISRKYVRSTGHVKTCKNTNVWPTIEKNDVMQRW